MIIQLPIRFEGSKGEKIIYTSFNPNFPFSLIDADHAKDIANSQKLFRTLKTINGDANNITADEIICSDFYINEIRMSDGFYIVHDLKEQAIIGAATIRKWRMKLDFEINIVSVDPEIGKPILKIIRPRQMTFCY
jgi:hypothetical protein